jgi:betaine-aldehyde dehydrogenase
MIDGKFVSPSDNNREDVINPATGEVIAKAPLSSKRDVDSAVKAAKSAFETWGVTTPGDRMALLLKLADRIEERADELADIESADAGKPRSAFFEDEIPFMCDNLRYFAGAARNMDGRATGEYLEGYTSWVRRRSASSVRSRRTTR